MKRRASACVLPRILLLFAVPFLLQVQSGYARVELAPCKNNYSPQQQIELGQKAAQQVYQQMPVLPDSSPVTKYVQDLGKKLAAQAPGYKWPYNFHVANVADINAFALPGGTIFVNLGTIQAAQNEAELAGVMAHEISHVVLQHSVCNAEKEQKVGLIAGIGQIAAGIFLGGTAGQLAQQGIGLGAGLGFLKMSREAEKQADLMGAGILYDTGYDPHAMAKFFDIIRTKYGEGGAQFLSDHPNPGNRSEYIDKEISTFVPKRYIENTAAFKRIHNTVSGMRAYTAKEVQSGVWKRESPNQQVRKGVNQPAGSANTNVDLNTSGAWKTFRGNNFSIEAPQAWQAYGNETSAMLAPAGGIVSSPETGAATVVYGMLTDRYQPPSGSNTTAALDALIDGIVHDNPGLVAGKHSDVTVNGVTGHSVECNNPQANGGKGEHDWIVAFPQRDGTLRYFVFVAPTQDFDKLRPAFQKMLQSVRIG